MADFLPTLAALGVPVALALAAAACMMLLAGLTLSRPRLVVYPFLLMLCVHAASGYGMQTSYISLYSRGSGRLVFSFWQIALVAAFVWVFLSARLLAIRESDRALIERPSFVPWAWAWAGLLVGHVLAGLMMNVEFARLVSGLGFIEFVWMSLIAGLVVLAFRTREDVEELLRAIVVVALARAVYGLVRMALFGGDPANIYENSQHLGVTLTYFDIADSLLSALAVVISLHRLLGDTPREGWQMRILYAATAVLGLLNIAFTYRRTALIGICVALIVLFVFLPRKRRVQFVLVAVPVAIVGIAVIVRQRLGTFGSGSFLDMFFYDMIRPEVGEGPSRRAELELGLQAFLSSPWVGLGAWGQYPNATMIGWQVGSYPGSFVHSGPIHLAMKAGLVGLIVFAGFSTAIVRATVLALRECDPALKTAAIAGLAGLCFSVVDFLVSPPALRILELTGLCIALPYIALHAARARQQAPRERQQAMAMSVRVERLEPQTTGAG